MGSAAVALLRLPAALAAAIEDPARPLQRHVRQALREAEAEQQRLQAVFENLQQLPDPLRERILCMADALQQLEQFSEALHDAWQLAAHHRRICSTSRAHRDAARATPYRVSVAPMHLWRLRRLQGCLAWLGCIKVAELRLEPAGLTQRVVAELAAGLAEHVPGCCVANTTLGLVAMQPGEVFETGLLEAFASLHTLHLVQYASAELARLPDSCAAIFMTLPGRPANQHQQQQQQGAYLLPAQGLLRPLASAPAQPLKQLVLKGALSDPAGRGGLEVEIDAELLFATAADAAITVHTLILRVPPRTAQQQRRGLLALLLVPSQALRRWGQAAGVWVHPRVRQWLKPGSQHGGTTGTEYEPLALASEMEGGSTVADVSWWEDAERGIGQGEDSSWQQQFQEQEQQQQRQRSSALIAALLDSFESSGCQKAVLQVTCLQLVEMAPGAEDSLLPAERAAGGAESSSNTEQQQQQQQQQHQQQGSQPPAAAGSTMAVPSLPLRYAQVKQLLVEQPRRKGVLTAAIDDNWLAEAGEGAAALGADAEMFSLIVCRRTAELVRPGSSSKPMQGALAVAEEKMRRPLLHALKMAAGLLLTLWGCIHALFISTSPLAWLFRACLLFAVLLSLWFCWRGRAGAGTAAGGQAAGQCGPRLQALRTVLRRLKMMLMY